MPALSFCSGWVARQQVPPNWQRTFQQLPGHFGAPVSAQIGALNASSTLAANGNTKRAIFVRRNWRRNSPIPHLPIPTIYRSSGRPFECLDVTRNDDIIQSINTAPETKMTTTATKTDTLIDLLFDAPQENVEAVQNAIRHVAAGEYRAAYQALQFAADWHDEGHEWADRAERMAAILRAKAPAF